MKRRAISKKASKSLFKRKTGIQKLNTANPKSFRGGIRL